MDCPHCRHRVAPVQSAYPIPDERGLRNWRVRVTRCPNCLGDTVEFACEGRDAFDWRRAHPLGMAPILPAGVPERLARLHREAAMLVSISPTFSAVASRRCLEGVLKHHGHGASAGSRQEPVLANRIHAFVKEPTSPPADLAGTIDAVRVLVNSGAHPTDGSETSAFVEEPTSPTAPPADLAGAVDAVRVLGNSGAHPADDSETGDLFEATEEDAQDALDLLEALLVHFHGQPADRAARWAAFKDRVGRRARRAT
jgi:hypothetical protein